MPLTPHIVPPVSTPIPSSGTAGDRLRAALVKWHGFWYAFAAQAGLFRDGIAEGCELLQKYERLARLSNRELARSGLSRDTIVNAVRPNAKRTFD